MALNTWVYMALVEEEPAPKESALRLQESEVQTGKDTNDPTHQAIIKVVASVLYAGIISDSFGLMRTALEDLARIENKVEPQKMDMTPLPTW